MLSDDSKIVKVTGIKEEAHTVSILVRGSNKLIVDEAERSLHDALCVVRAIVKSRALVVGGGAPEIEISSKLATFARTVEGVESIVVRAFAEALEVIPYTLAENAGLSPVHIVTELKNRHANGERYAGISLRRFGIADDISKENVVQPMLISSSALNLATECVRMILKIDDIVISVR
jgi:T-complex protein 1 subunit delta